MTTARRPIRVLHVLTRAESGGPERRRLLLAEHLSRSDFLQHVVCLTSLDQFRQQFGALDVQVTTMGPGTGFAWDARSISRVSRVRRAFRPDIVHGAVFEGVTMAALSGFLAPKARLIIEETGDPISVGRSWRGNLQMRLYSSLADACVAVSPAVEDYFVRTISVPSSKVHLIPNGVESATATTPETRAQARRLLDLQDDDFVVGSVGRMLDSHKRFTDLVSALRILKEQIPQIKLLLIGGGEDLEVVRAFAASLGVEDRLRLPGYRSDVGRLYPAMDVFALASVQESFGLVLAEAMWSGVPVVATRVGGVPFVVDSGRTGILVPARQPEQMANAIARIRGDEAFAGALRRAAMESARERFSAQRYARDVENLYRNVTRSAAFRR